MGRFLGGALAFVAGIVALTVIFGSWYTVDEGERGVVLRNGAIVDVADPGLHFKKPWIEDVETVSTRTATRMWDNMESYSRDQQPAHFKISVNYRIPSDKVRDVYASYGSEENLLARTVDRHVPQQMKAVFGQFTAATSIQERDRLNQTAFDAISKSVTGPIIIESIQVEDIKFSGDYEEAVKLRMQAEVEVQKIRQNAEREKVTAEITVITAKAQADAQRAQAQGQADATLLQAQADAKSIELKGTAQAQAIEAKGKAFAANPSYPMLIQAERWNGELPRQMIPGNAVPFLSLQPETVARTPQQ